MRFSTEVLVLGGGPAGLSAGIALRQRGMDVTVVDALPPAIDKACGEGLMPGALAALERLGVAMTAADGMPFYGIRFLDEQRQAEARFPGRPGLGVRRLRLHERLRERAEACGVNLLWNTRCQPMGPGRAMVDGEERHYRWLVGADGQSSTVRAWAGMSACRVEKLRYGMRRHYRMAPWSELVEVYWGERGQAYVTPVAEDCVCVAFVGRAAHREAEEWLGDFPAIAERVEGVPLASAQRGAVSATRVLREVERGGVALVGDASGSVDAVTGEGMASCFLQAEALADAITSGRPEAYEKAHRRIGRLPHRMSLLLLLMDRFPGLEQRALEVFAERPEYFAELLGVHVGARGLGEFVVRRGPGFCMGLLRAGG
jgi:flavin-dependent dehydrogenase